MPRFRAVVITPAPRALLRISWSPGRAPDFWITLRRDDLARHRQAILGFRIADGMPAGDDRSRFFDFVGAAAQDFRQKRFVQIVGPGHQIYGHQRTPAHGVNIAQGISCRNGAKVIGVIHHGREKISCRDDGAIFVDAADGRVVRLSQTNQNLRIISVGKLLA